MTGKGRLDNIRSVEAVDAVGAKCPFLGLDDCAVQSLTVPLRREDLVHLVDKLGHVLEVHPWGAGNWQAEGHQLSSNCQPIMRSVEPWHSWWKSNSRH